jgi:hypothetical protein
MNKVFKPILLLVCISSFFSCNRRSEYHKMVIRELAKGVRYDTLFFDISLGMTSEDFYSHCWDLNREGLIRQGASNTTVYYQVKDFKYPAGMDFYPAFYKDRIYEMPVVFSYDGWVPWNKSQQADSLKIEVLDLMEEWFGTGFIEIENPNYNGGNAFVKVDGNRRIFIYNVDESKVYVDFVDLLVLKEVEKSHRKENK